MIGLVEDTANTYNMLMKSFVVASIVFDDCKEAFLKIKLHETSSTIRLKLRPV